MRVGGLTNGLTYSFTVRATNAAGTGAESGQSPAVTPHSAPDAPSIISATPGNASASISWNAPASDGGSAITEYSVTAYRDGAAVKTVLVHHSARSATITGLTNGGDYVFTVTASNEVGPSAPSSPSATVRPTVLAGLPVASPVPLPV
jgi:predicted phage tail protein